jgi:cell pole-organizing protein PopZ
MSDSKSPQNLSMDEILATIRRIIAEDEQSGGTPGGSATRGVPASVRPVSVPPAPVANTPVSNIPAANASLAHERTVGEPRETTQAAAAAGADNVLDLTDALNEDGSVRRLAPLVTASGASEPAPAPPVSAPELARTPPFAERAAETISVEARRVDMRPVDVTPQADRAVDPGPVLPAATPPADTLPSETPLGATPLGATDEPLVSDVAATAAATAFEHLASAPRARHEPPLVGDRPLDEIVRELLRPLLRSWLNENLPGIVERLVQTEIARISARSGPG